MAFDANPSDSTVAVGDRFLEAAGQSVALVFLDLAQAFDGMDRAWLLRSFKALGPPACLPR